MHFELFFDELLPFGGASTSKEPREAAPSDIVEQNNACCGAPLFHGFLSVVSALQGRNIVFSHLGSLAYLSFLLECQYLILVELGSEHSRLSVSHPSSDGLLGTQ